MKISIKDFIDAAKYFWWNPERVKQENKTWFNITHLWRNETLDVTVRNGFIVCIIVTLKTSKFNRDFDSYYFRSIEDFIKFNER